MVLSILHNTYSLIIGFSLNYACYKIDEDEEKEQKTKNKKYINKNIHHLMENIYQELEINKIILARGTRSLLLIS